MRAFPPTPALRPIFLWGMSGVGKSTVGPRLAHRLGLDAIDLDAQIAADAGQSISAIFAAEGEVGFRRREAAALRQIIGDDRPRVIILGGGALLPPELRRAARASGWVITLDAAVPTLIERLRGATDRPLLGADRAARIAQLHAERAPAYADVDQIVPTDGLDPRAVVEAICARLRGEAAA